MKFIYYLEILNYFLMFAYDIALLLTTPVSLQRQLNVLVGVANRLSLLVNLEKTKIVVFRWGLSDKCREMVLLK